MTQLFIESLGLHITENNFANFALSIIPASHSCIYVQPPLNRRINRRINYFCFNPLHSFSLN